jgi:hypothetical protein
MKLAPWFGLAAIALLLGATTLAGRREPVVSLLPLELEGIDTVVVPDAQVEVVIDATRRPAARIEWQFSSELSLLARRADRTLVVSVSQDADYRRYATVKMVLPPTVRSLVIAGGTVEAKTAPPALHVSVGEQFHWTGDIPALTLVQRPPEFDCDCAAGNSMSVAGRVATLHATAWNGTVRLSTSRAPGRTTLSLGPRATYSLEGLRGPAPVVTVVPYAGKVPPPKPAKREPPPQVAD